MAEKIVVGPVSKGLRTDRLPFYIDNDSFPSLINAYQWRGRVKRKRGTTLLNRLSRFFNSNSTVYSSTATQVLDGSGNGNLLTDFITLQTNASIEPGSVTITDTTASTTYTDPSKDGTLSPSGTINYATGEITILAAAGHTIRATFIYYPALPVMGLEDLVIPTQAYPGTLGFDTTYSYNIVTAEPYNLYDVSFYKNPPTGLYPSYVAKTNVTPTTWNGFDYQQFFTVNYQGSLWTTNGIDIPFTGDNISMQFAPASSITFSSWTSATVIVLVIANCPLVIGDFVFLNEWTANTEANAATLNFQTGYVIATSGTPTSLTVTIKFPYASIANTTYTPGIVQYLTNVSDSTKDCLRWYDGDPTNGSVTNPVLDGHLGWVNFAPPLSFGDFSISDEPAHVYYLVGARIIVPFKDYLLFFGPVIQTSSPNSQVYLQDSVVFSQVGTAYYTASFTLKSGTVPENFSTINPILVPVNQTAIPASYFEDITGYGGSVAAGLDLPIVTANLNQDVLIVGFFNKFQTKLVFTGNNLNPFEFFFINSELGNSSTFSSIVLDEGVLTRGSRAFVITNQTSTTRFDLAIPDQVFEISKTNNGDERFTAIRDFENEWVYFTFVSNIWKNTYPNQTLFYNYRDASWAIFNESYTTYGLFRPSSGYTWGTLPKSLTWGTWTDPWNSGGLSLLNPKVIGGNQQGYVMFREDDVTNEDTSLYISNINSTVVTSPNHCLNLGDYIIISDVLGTIGPNVNGKIFSVGAPVTTDTFTINPTVATGTYVGGGQITRMYVPFIQTKQFPVAWELSRKTRLGVQQYLLTKTYNSQVTLYIYLSQSSAYPFNTGPIVPTPQSINNSLIYDTILFTCLESANLGLTPANTNLQMLGEINAEGNDAFTPQEQIWHRVNTSLIGDTVQVAITMNDTQMRAFDPDTLAPINAFSEIELHSMIFDISPSQMLS